MKKDIIKKLANEKIIKYLKYIIPFILFESSLILITYFYKNNLSYYLGIFFVVMHSLAFITYVVVIDGGTAKSIKKKDFNIRGSNMPKEQLTTYYNALKLTLIYRAIINALSTLFVLGISVINFI